MKTNDTETKVTVTLTESETRLVLSALLTHSVKYAERAARCDAVSGIIYAALDEAKKDEETKPANKSRSTRMRPSLPDIGRYPVWLRGSRLTIHRTVYVSDDRYLVVWQGSLVEVRRSNSGMGFCSVEQCW